MTLLIHMAEEQVSQKEYDGVSAQFFIRAFI